MSAGGFRTGAGAARGLRRSARALGPLAAAALLACAAPESGWPLLGAPEPPTRPWAGFENAGPLPVADAGENAPGPAIYRHVARQPTLSGFLREQGPPATLEVTRREGGPLRVLLRYSERGGRCPIRLERTREGDARWSASLPDCPGARRATPPRAPEPSEPAGATPAPAEACRPPTEVERLECPIDPEREDCAALCRCDGSLKWCE